MSEKNVSLQREGTGEDGLPTEGKEHASTYKKYPLSPSKEVFNLILTYLEKRLRAGLV